MASKLNPVHHSNGSPDARYTVRREWCGHPEQRWVARFCGEWIGQSQFYSSAMIKAVGHNAVRLGAAVITEQPA